jgi:hypothetical protein
MMLILRDVMQIITDVMFTKRDEMLIITEVCS